jgi:chemotaxis protein methyltransferase CheR
MIYFDVPTKRSILQRIESRLAPDGYLLLGGAETTLNLSTAYRRIEQLKLGFYQLTRN